MCNQGSFYLFKSPMVHRYSTDLFRKLLNPFHRFIYAKFIEDAYTDEKFINGAKKVSIFFIKIYYKLI